MIAELRHEMLGHFDEIYRRFDRLEQEYQAIQRLGLQRRSQSDEPAFSAIRPRDSPSAPSPRAARS